MPCCFAVAFSTLAWAGARETCKWSVSTFLPYCSGPGVRVAAARGLPILHSGVEEVFPTNLISLNIEMRGGRGVGSSILTTPETFELCKRAAHMFLRGGGGGPAAEVEVECGVATALKG